MFKWFKLPKLLPSFLLFSLSLLASCNNSILDESQLPLSSSSSTYFLSLEDAPSGQVETIVEIIGKKPLSVLVQEGGFYYDLPLDENQNEFSKIADIPFLAKEIYNLPTVPTLTRLEYKLEETEVEALTKVGIKPVLFSKNSQTAKSRALYQTDRSRNLKPDYSRVEFRNTTYNGKSARLIYVAFRYTDPAKIELLKLGASPALEPDVKIKTRTEGMLWWTKIFSWARLEPDVTSNRWGYVTNLPNSYVDTQFSDGEEKTFSVCSTAAEKIQLNVLYESWLYCKPGNEPAPNRFSFEMQWFPVSGSEGDPWGVGIYPWDAKFGTEIGSGTIPGTYTYR